MKELIKFWKQIDLSKKPYIHPKDDFLKENDKYINSYKNYTDYISNKNFGFDEIKKAKFHISLLPSPYVGNLNKAKIFILMLNPGFGISDYYSETFDEDYNTSIQNTLIQMNLSKDFPFHFLNPKFFWTGGGQYWGKKFQDIILQLKEVTGSFESALKIISKYVCSLELIPYHSKHNPLSPTNIEKLGSFQIMKKTLHDSLIPKAIKGEILIICTRSATNWGIKTIKDPNIVIYNSGESRGASISLKTRGGKKIWKFFKNRIVR